MVKVLIEVDPLIESALQSIGKERGWSRSAVIRSALYALVWKEKREGLTSVLAPTCGPVIESERVRVVNRKLRRVDEWGLLV
jgi:hypothetical protein